jgi:signal peptidase I
MNGELIPKFLIIATAICAVLVLVERLFPRSENPSLIRINIHSLVVTVFPALVLVLLVRSFVAEPFRIPSSSMQPGLITGDYILVNKNRYGLRLPLTNYYIYRREQPKRGDVVVFFPPNDDRYFIKRIIGMPGDHVIYRNKQLTVNGKQMRYESVLPPVPTQHSDPNTYLRERLGDDRHNIMHDVRRPSNNFEVHIAAGHYYVLGDNRDNSRDSRIWGQVPRSRLIGPATILWMHWDGFGSMPRFSRSGSIE